MDEGALQVLLVEDDPAFAVLVQEMLRHLDVSLAHVGSAAAAVTHLARWAADCVVLDMGLPDTSGPQALQMIRGSFPDVPVLVLTGRDAGSAAALAVEHGAHRALSKDHADAGVLREAIGQAIVRQHPERMDRQRRRLAALLEVAAADVPAEVRIGQALTMCRDDLGMDLGAIARVDGPRYRVTHTDEDHQPVSQVEVDVARTCCALTLAADDVVAIANMGASSERAHPAYEEAGIEAYIGAPLVVNGEVWGSVSFTATAPTMQPWTELDRTYVGTLSSLLGGWIGETIRTRQLDEAMARFSLAFDNAPNGMAIASLDGQLLQVNQALCDQLHYSASQLEQMRFVDITHPEDLKLTAEFVRGLLAGTRSSNQLEKRLVRRDGSTYWAMVHAGVLRDPDGSPRYFVNQVEDITERRAARERMSHLALHDALTGLPNRVLLEDRLEHELAAARRSGQGVTVLFIDLDRFKAVNDELGHAAGDALLKVVAGRLAETVRPYDTAARLGGDEFVVVCGGLLDPEDVAPIVARIHEAITVPVEVAGHRVEVGASIGVAHAAAEDAPSATELLRSADAAMYVAKAEGRSAVQASPAGLEDVVIDRVVLEQQLRDAIEAAPVGPPGESGLTVHYQPIHATDTGRTEGLEALVRLVHPVHGMLLPGSFLPLAEASGLVVPLGRWVLRQALHDWADEPGLQLSVNVAVQELVRPDYVDEVLAALADAGVPPHRLCLEVTETADLHAEGPAMRSLHRLRLAGIRLAIDDFGAGHTALRYLNQTPFTDLKIDRSFLVDLQPGSASWSILNAIVSMCTDLGLRCTAEGIEDAVTLDLVRGVGCATTQGYLHARPASREDVCRLLQAA